MNWAEIIRANRPKVSDSSIRTYASTIRGLAKVLDASGPEWFEKNTRAVMAHLKPMSAAKRKNILSSVMSVCSSKKALDVYRAQMLTDIKAYDGEQQKQQMTEKQKANWISQEEVISIYDRLEKDTKHLWTKENLTPAEMKRLMQYVALSLYVLIPPRRILDYTLMKVRGVDEQADNYIDRRVLIFNTYKTAKSHGQQKVNMPPKLHNILSRWRRKHDNEYLLFDSKTAKPLTQSKMTLLINNIFGKKISANMLRHIYLSDKLKNVPALSELAETAEDMGHTLGTQMQYRKLPAAKK